MSECGDVKRSSNFRTSVLNYDFEFNLHTFGFGYKENIDDRIYKHAIDKTNIRPGPQKSTEVERMASHGRAAETLNT